MNKQLLAYLESVGAGAAVAALTAAYEALSKQGGTIIWQPVLAAGLLAAMGYAVSALRWLQTPPTPPLPPVALIGPATVTPVAAPETKSQAPAPVPAVPEAPIAVAPPVAPVPSPTGGVVLPPRV